MPYKPERIVIEATGRLEMPFTLACSKASLLFVIANPIHLKRFAGAIGQQAKPILTAFKDQIQKIEKRIIKLLESCPEYLFT